MQARPSAPSQGFYLCALKRWPKCLWQLFKRGNELQDQVAAVVWVLALALGGVSAATDKLDQASWVASARHQVILPAIVLVLVLPYIVALRKEHELRTEAEERRHEEEVGAYASRNLALVRQAKEAESRSAELNMKLESLERATRANPEERLRLVRAACDQLGDRISAVSAGAEFELYFTFKGTIRELLEFTLLPRDYQREHQSLCEAMLRVESIAAHNSRSEKIDPQYTHSAMRPLREWLAEFRQRVGSTMLRLDRPLVVP